MSYAPLWLEIVVTSILFTATTMAVAVRAKGLLRWLALLPNCAVFLGLWAAAAGAGDLKCSLGLSESFFAYTVSLFSACVVGSIVVQRMGGRRQPGIARAVAAWKLGQLVIGTLICSVVVLMTLWNMDLEARNQAEVIRAEAGGLLLAVAPANVPDSQNAAISYQAAFGALDAEIWKGKESLLLGDTDPSPASLPVTEMLSKYAGALRLLRTAARLQVCRFPHQYSRPSVDLLLPELNAARVANLLLNLDAKHELALGHVKSGIGDIDAMFALSRATGQEPILISGLVSIGLNAMAVQSLASALRAVTSADELDDLHVGEVGTMSRIMHRDLCGEEAFGLAYLADIGSGRAIADALWDTNQGHELTLRERSSAFPYRVFFLQADVRGYERLMSDMQTWADQPYYKAAVEMKSDEARKIRESGLLTRTIAPALAHVNERTAVAEALHTGALVGVAVIRFRLDHAALPDSLDTLVPKYLDAIPFDPFDGQPIRFRKTAEDWRVYSLGPAGKDAGGTPYNSHTHMGNVSFIVKNAPH